MNLMIRTYKYLMISYAFWNSDYKHPRTLGKVLPETTCKRWHCNLSEIPPLQTSGGREFRKHTMALWFDRWFEFNDILGRLWNIKDHITRLLGPRCSDFSRLHDVLLGLWGAKNHQITNSKCSQNAGRVLCKVASLTIGLNESCSTSFPSNKTQQVKLPWMLKMTWHLCKCCLSLYHWL